MLRRLVEALWCPYCLRFKGNPGHWVTWGIGACRE